MSDQVLFAGALPSILIEEPVRLALAEDLGRAGDITTQATIPDDVSATATLIARAPGVICGLDIARAAFRSIDPVIGFESWTRDGSRVEKGDVLARIDGNARAILIAERVALNYLGRLSGVASLTAQYVDHVAHTKTQICDTRKTTPLLRAFEKYAVRCGGGANHRFGLDDAILIKDNHIAVAGGVIPALRAAKRYAGHLVKIEIEVDTLDQLREVLAEGADVVLLDNMPIPTLQEAVGLIKGAMICEASGGVSLETVAAIAETGVDLISVGALTHSAAVLDLALDIDME
jgi:nicotinate-nucleotide pyrophosphorylase (carboxylating)